MPSSPSRCFLKKLLLISALVLSEFVAAGFNGTYNTTPVVNPAIRSIQLASILCNASASAHQGYIRNNTAKSTVAAAKLRNTTPHIQLSQPHHHNEKRQVVNRHHPKEVSRIPDRYVSSRHHGVAGEKAVLKKAGSRDSFKNEAHFTQEGGKYRRVTKRQAKKKGWAHPEATQVTSQTSLAVPLPTPMETSSEEKVHPVSGKGKGSAKHPVRKKSKHGIPVVNCPECDSVEEGSFTTEDKKTVPFKMMRYHGVIAIPQFELDGENAIAAKSTEPRIMIKKFRDVDGELQFDKSFSDDGVDELSIPLPTGDRVTEFTLAKDKLVVLSQPEDYDGLSRVTTMSLYDTNGSESVDGGLAPGLWVKGELFRYHDNTLYTFSPGENKVFIYPLADSDSTESADPGWVVDLNPIREAGEELVSVLADGDQTYVATRKSSITPEESSIHVYQFNDLEEMIGEKVRVVAPRTDQQFQLYSQDEKLVLVHLPLNGLKMEGLGCANLAENNIKDANSVLAKAFSMPARSRRGIETDDKTCKVANVFEEA